MAKQKSGVLSTVIMIAAFAGIGLFVYWLAVVSEPTSSAVAVESAAQEAPAQAPILNLATFAANPMSQGEAPVALEAVEVREVLGTLGFLFSLPDGAPYFVRLPVGSNNTALLPGTRARVTGPVEVMNDSVLQAWTAQGILTDSIHRMTMGSLTTYLDATMLEVEAPASPPAAPGQE